MRNTNERWKELCEQATVENDTDKLLDLVSEINRLLEEKHDVPTSRRNVTSDILARSAAHQQLPH